MICCVAEKWGCQYFTKISGDVIRTEKVEILTNIHYHHYSNSRFIEENLDEAYRDAGLVKVNIGLPIEI